MRQGEAFSIINDVVRGHGEMMLQNSVIATLSFLFRLRNIRRTPPCLFQLSSPQPGNKQTRKANVEWNNLLRYLPPTVWTFGENV